MSDRLNFHVVDENEFYRRLFHCFVRYEHNAKTVLWRNHLSLTVVGNEDHWQLNAKIFEPEIYFRVNPRKSQLWSILHYLPEYAQRVKSDENWDRIIANFSFEMAIWIDEGNVHKADGAPCKNLQPGDHGYLLLG